MSRRHGVALAIISLLVLIPVAAGAGADYLAKADANIERHRKADALVEFVTAGGQPVRNAEVVVDQETQDFLFGCIVFPLAEPDMGAQERELFERRFLELFNFAVFPFYWSHYEKEPGKPRWPDFEPVLEWCARNNVTAKGHPLVWVHRAGIPQWLNRFPVELHETLLEARVINAVAAYAGKVDIWDVVNEFVHTSTWEHKDARAGERTLSEIAGYVEKALRWAHLGNPEATLILNEYTVIPYSATSEKRSPPPRERFLALVTELKRRRVPRFEVGFQAHEPRDAWYPPEQMWGACDAFADLGYPIHITEYIPRSSGNKITGGYRSGTWTEQAQADYADEFLRLAFGHPAVASFNFWGLSDRKIWLSEGGLVDEDYNPKPIFTRLKKLIKQQWMTRKLSVRTDEDGKVRFRGFHGNYRIGLRTEQGREQVFRLHLTKGGDNRWQFRVESR